MYTNNLYKISENTEVVIRYARGEKFAKGKVTKTTKTQLTVEYTDENGRSFTERFAKSNGDQIGAKAYIGRMFEPVRLMTYADADDQIQERKVKESIELEKSNKRMTEAQNKFNEIIEKTRKDRQSLVLIDEETQTYKVVVMSEKGKRMLGFFKVRAEEYFSWDAKEYQNGFAFDLVYSLNGQSWGSRSTENAKTFEEGLDKIMYELYTSESDFVCCKNFEAL